MCGTHGKGDVHEADEGGAPQKPQDGGDDVLRGVAAITVTESAAGLYRDIHLVLCSKYETSDMADARHRLQSCVCRLDHLMGSVRV